MKTKIAYLISCTMGEWDDFSSKPIIVALDMETALMICEELNRDNGNPFRKYALSVLGETSLPGDADFSFQEILVTEQ